MTTQLGDIAIMTAADHATPTFTCPDLMAAMIVALDIDVDDLGRPWHRGSVQYAVARCAACTASVACRQWLGGGPGGRAGHADFCPNADLFDWFKGQSTPAD
jgi:hypothetical protein